MKHLTFKTDSSKLRRSMRRGFLISMILFLAISFALLFLKLDAVSAGPSWGRTRTEAPAASSPLTLLHQFNAFDEGWGPYSTAALTISGNRIYGATYDAGANGKGVIFGLDNDGSDYSVLHTFSALDSGGFNTDGASPACTLTVSGNKLYGTATTGGSLGNGTCYSLDTNGDNFTTLLNLSGVTPNTGYGLHSPEGELTLSGSTLYGVTIEGGGQGTIDSLLGRIFSAETTGGGETLFNFVDPGNQGYDPRGTLVLFNGKLYGFADNGGGGRGTLYSIDTAGSNFNVLHHFTDAEGNPYGRLLRAGNTLYGTTQNSTGNKGIIYSMDISGSDFTPLHTYPISGTETNPSGLVMSGDILYGSTQYGGTHGDGTLFSLRTNGSGYRTLWSFERFVDGSNPTRLVLDGHYLYGMAASGGMFSHGAIFRFSIAAQQPVFDYDGDGKDDISVFRPTDGAWYEQRSRDGFYGAEFGFGSDKLTPADYDGDGKTDIAVYRPSTGIWYVFNSSDGTVSYNVFGIGEDLPVPADYDADGRADIAVFRPSTATWYRRNSSDGSFFAIQFGSSEDKPTIGDFDADGKADIAIFRPSVGAWYQLYSSDNSLHGAQFGFGTDIIVPADYDGDGKTDIAVFRPSTALWYIAASSTGEVLYHVFGLESDIPAPADFDGDGKADISVFRPSDGIWYRMNSSDGSFFAFQFGTSGDKPTQTAFRY